MPRDFKAREALPPQAATDGPGIWYTLGETLIRPYLLCLHKSHDLHAEFAIEDIPHYFRDAPVKRYQAILAGKPLPPAESKRKRQRAIVVDLQPEFQSDEEPLALQDEAAEEPDDDNGEYGLLADEEDVDIIKILEDAIEEEELLRQMIEQQEVQEPEPESDDVDLVEEGAEDDESEQDAEEPEPDAPAPAEGITSFGRLRKIPWSVCHCPQEGGRAREVFGVSMPLSYKKPNHWLQKRHLVHGRQQRACTGCSPMVVQSGSGSSHPK